MFLAAIIIFKSTPILNILMTQVQKTSKKKKPFWNNLKGLKLLVQNLCKKKNSKKDIAF